MGCISRTLGLPLAITAGDLGERFGVQVAQMVGAAEHRSERMRSCVSEEWRPQRRRWDAWAPKVRRGAPAGIASSRVQAQLIRDRFQGVANNLHVLVEGYTQGLGARDELLAVHAAREGLVLHLLAHRARLDRAQ